METDKNTNEPEQQSDFDNFEQFVKGLLSLTPEEVKEILEREKREGIPPDPGAEPPPVPESN